MKRPSRDGVFIAAAKSANTMKPTLFAIAARTGRAKRVRRVYAAARHTRFARQTMTLCRTAQEIDMNWDRIEGNWKKIKGNVLEQWDGLTDDQLSSRIQETYGSSDDEAERELTDWQQRLSEINRAVRM